jgi:ribonuclease PH
MVHRKGTKNNPFKVGERVHVLPEGADGVVKKVIHPQFRGWIKYDVEFEPRGTTRIERHSVMTLRATEEEDGAR